MIGVAFPQYARKAGADQAACGRGDSNPHGVATNRT